MESRKPIDILPEVERQANSSEHPTHLLLSRLHNPAIQQQLIDFLVECEQGEAGTINRMAVFDTNGKLQYDAHDRPIFKDIPYIPRSKEKLVSDFETHLTEIEQHTPVTFDNTLPNTSATPIQWNWFRATQEATVQQKSIAEAHEKGHMVRRYDTAYADRLCAACFDTAHIIWDARDDAWLQESYKDERNYREAHIKYLFSATEVAERMSQLKNYFGFTGDEIFTAAHLHYAREHYISDTGADNWMSHFFQAITPEKEATFLSLMNRMGI